MDRASLRRLVISFERDDIVVRTLYRTSSGSGPSTKARRREVEALARDGLTAAVEALDRGDAEDLGTSGYSVREDTLGLPVASSDAQKPMRRAA